MRGVYLLVVFSLFALAASAACTFSMNALVAPNITHGATYADTFFCPEGQTICLDSRGRTWDGCNTRSTRWRTGMMTPNPLADNATSVACTWTYNDLGTGLPSWGWSMGAWGYCEPAV